MIETPKNWNRQVEEMLDAVKRERLRQVDKWGVRVQADGTWSLILGEEVGELCQALLERRPGNAKDRAHVVEEAIQVAAVALAIAQHETYAEPV